MTRKRTSTRHLTSLAPEDREVYQQIPAKVECVNHPMFAQKETEEQLFGEGTDVEVPYWVHVPDVPEEMPVRPARPTVLSHANEKMLFLRYNYACYRLGNLAAAQYKRRSAARSAKMVFWQKRALKARSELVRANMALVLAMAKRSRITTTEFGELVSEGNMALLRSVEKFDVSRGYRFSTYACRAILKSFSRLAIRTGRYRQHFPTEFDPDLERSDYDTEKHENQRAESLEDLREILSQNRARLTEVERRVLWERFAIHSRGKMRTLTEVGRTVGLTNERVRQIQNLALNKIRGVFTEQQMVS